MSDRNDPGEDYAVALDALAVMHAAEAEAHRAEAKRLAGLAGLAAGHTEQHAAALYRFRMRSAEQAAGRAAASAVASDSCIAGAEALRFRRAAPLSP